MNSCLSCGSDNAEDVRFCVKCGKRLEPPAPPPEFWRYNTEDLAPPRPARPNAPPLYQPPSFTDRPPYAPPQQDPAPQRPYAPPKQADAPRRDFNRNAHAYQPPAPRRPQPPAPYAPAPFTPAPAAAAQTTQSSTLARAGLSVGVGVACIALLGLVPCLGWLNWFAIIFGKAALVLCIVALVSEKDPAKRGKATAGLVITSAALGVAVIRLIISLAFGGGCL
jgi:hypothetical protein